jgi:hypothetical protein
MWLTAVSTALRDCAISPTAADEVMEPFRLAGDAARDFLDIAGDVGELDAEAADAVGELVDQPFGQRSVGSGVQYCKLCDGHVR